MFNICLIQLFSVFTLLFSGCRLKYYCERLMFYNPIDYGRKAEEVLWRKVFYDIIQLVKRNKRVIIWYFLFIDKIKSLICLLFFGIISNSNYLNKFSMNLCLISKQQL